MTERDRRAAEQARRESEFVRAMQKPVGDPMVVTPFLLSAFVSFKLATRKISQLPRDGLR